MNILETQFYYISTASRVKVKEIEQLSRVLTYISVYQSGEILRSLAQKKKHTQEKRSRREKNTSRIKIRFWCWKEEEKGETRTRRTSEQQNEQENRERKKEVKQEKCRSEYRKKSKFLIRREENIYSWRIWKEILKRNWRNHRDQAKVSEREKEKKQYRGCLHFKRAQGQRPRKYF